MMKLYSVIAGMCLMCLSFGCSDDDTAGLPVVTPETTGTYTDERDGYEYHWVRIGGLDWMVENSHYDLGDENNCRFYVSYENYESSFPEDEWSGKYGFLYSYQGALDAVPDGWRLPSDADWKKLEQALGMSQIETDAMEWRGMVTADLMRQSNEGTMLGFQMAGYYTEHTIMSTSKWRFMGSYGFYWTSTKDESKDGEYYYYRKLFYNSSQVFRQSMEPEKNMLSVRFVRDAQ